MSANDVRRKVGELSTKLRRRDRVIYLSGAVIAPSWAAFLWYMPDLWMMAGAGLATALWVLYQLRKRSGARAISSDLAGRPLVDFHRTLIERERDFYRNGPLWFFLPVGASQILILISFLTNARFPHTPPAVMGGLSYFGSTVAILVVAKNRWHREATALQAEIESLEGAK
jgi:hypothetical protein